MKKSSNAKMNSLLLAIMVMASVQNVKAQDAFDDTDYMMDGGTIEMDDLNIDGKLTASERLKKQREKLEERNRDMMEKKVEDIRIKQEIELTKNLQKAFNNSLTQMDQINTTQAAPVAPQPVVAAPVVETKVETVQVEEVKETNSKVIPFLGASAIKGNGIDFESKLNVGATLESKVLPNVTVGFGLGYTTLDITDISNNFINNDSQVYYNNGYNNYFGQGRAMSYSKLNLEANGKFFFTEDAKVKPFVGAQLNFNRSNIKYEDGGNGYSYNSVNFGNEGFSSNNLSAGVKLGAEVDFTSTIGLNVDLSYSKSITSGLGENADASNTNPDQVRLENVTRAMEKSDTTSISAGVVVKF